MAGLKEIFLKLSNIDVRPFADKKAGLDYLPWAKAHELMMANYPDYEWDWLRNENGDPYFMTDTGYFVVTEVTVGGIKRKEILAVTDYNNKTLTNPNAFDINTAIRRCYVKTLAQFGLGLMLYTKADKSIKSDNNVKTKPPVKAKKKTTAAAKKNAKAAWGDDPITEDQIAQLRLWCQKKTTPEKTVQHIADAINEKKATSKWAVSQLELLEKKNNEGQSAKNS